MLNTTNIKSYFGATNSYSGFVSRFSKIFDPLSLDRLFILKGGPGTGKSTLMKKISEDFNDYEIERIYCSSDISSLDGIIIKKENKKVAIVDGTAPHVVEPLYIGAVEEIVNLGEAFNVSLLTRARERIISESLAKKKEYASAYKELRSCSAYQKLKCELFLDIIDYNEAEAKALKFIENETSTKNSPKEYFLSSFSKDGLYHLPLSDANKNIVKIPFIYGFGFTLLDIISKQLLHRSSVEAIVLNNFDTSKLDAIITNTTIYTLDYESNECDEIISSKNLESILPKLNSFNVAIDYHLNKARGHLLEASTHHFNLEGIYTQCVDFSVIECLKEDIKKKIYEILG